MGAHRGVRAGEAAHPNFGASTTRSVAVASAKPSGLLITTWLSLPDQALRQQQPPSDHRERGRAPIWATARAPRAHPAARAAGTSGLRVQRLRKPAANASPAPVVSR